MPPLPAVPGVLKLVLSSSRSDSDVENILHIGYTGSPPSAANISTYLTSYVAPASETLFNAEGSTDLTGTTIEGIDLSSDTGASASVDFSSTGTRTGDFAPSSACVVTSWTIGRRYRGGHPRTYWPFGTAGTYESGSSKLWDTGFISAVETALGVWEGVITDVTVGATVFNTLVNVSYVDKNLNPDPPYRRTTPVVDVITGLVVKQRICSQRRRLGKLLG
jgi:hypothetical protein